MTGYRVAEEQQDPLEIDEALCRQQRFKERFVLQLAIAVLTLGFWLPGMLIWLALASGSMKAFADDYRVRIRDGVLSVGNAKSSRSVPLDSIADASVNDGKVTVSVTGGTALIVYGLRDPLGAVHAILQARRAFVAGVADNRPRVRVGARQDAAEEAEDPDGRATEARS